MTNQELEKYRIQLFRDAAGMEKKPDRTPLVSFFVTWKILDSPYKLAEAMNDYSKMEQVVRHHQEAYGFDTMPIIAIVAFSAIVYVIIYLVFKENGIFPVGTGLEKSDWLSFLGAYLSFIGTVIVSLIAIFQSIYYSELNERKDAENRKKEIQPIFSVKIVSIDMQLDGTAEAFSLYDKATNPIHKNVKISVENVNRFPIKHMIVFDKYITPLLKCNEIQYVHCAYYDSVDAKKWPKQMAVLTDEYERNDQGVPTWFNVNYEDVDGNEMFQRFELKDFDGKLYYALNSINDA